MLGAVEWVPIVRIVLPFCCVVVKLGPTLMVRHPGGGHPADGMLFLSGRAGPYSSRAWCPSGTFRIYKGMMQFMVLQLIGLALIMIFPEIALWLPRLMYGK